MKILKFGGSSLRDIPQIEKVAAIIKKEIAEAKELWVVVSAMGGVTDELIGIARAAASKDDTYEQGLAGVKKRHMDTVRALVEEGSDSTLKRSIEVRFDELERILSGVFALGELSDKVLDKVMSFGEIWSAHIVAEACRRQGEDAEFLDAQKLIVTDENFGAANVDFKNTAVAVLNHKNMSSGIRIVTGFIAASPRGVTTTLGRNGSDFSASILAAALEADETQIWTDVNGVMTANPAKVNDAKPITHMSYEEAMELSHFGAEVLHAPTLQPVMEENIPLLVKNTFNPSFEGTVVDGHCADDDKDVTGISTISDIALIRVQGSGMVGVLGISARLFGTLANHNVNVILISQGSSEHSICVAVAPLDVKIAKQCISEEFKYEIGRHMMELPIVEEELCVLAVVGEHMRRKPGIAGRLFSALGSESINVIAIAQGSSELNISIVIDKKDEIHALNVIHNAFFLN